MMSKSEAPTILCIELNDGDRLESSIFRLQKDWILRFTLGKGLFARKVCLTIQPGNQKFTFPEPKQLSDFDVFVEFVCEQFGSFRYEFFLEDSKKSSGDGFFHVVPEWNITGGKKLSLNSLSCITHLAKLLGPLNEWKSRLEVAHKAGYNCIHLTPIQTLGISNSSYSIADYQKLNPLFGTDVDFTDVQKLIDELENEWGMIFVQDVVWNHVARNSKWLQEHPECAFNCQNSPHLRPAYILDRALFHLSRDISEGKYADRGLPEVIDNDGHLGALSHILRSDILPSLKLWEFFQIGVDGMMEALRHSLGEGSFHHQSDGSTKLEVVQDREFKRFGSCVNLESAKRMFLSKISYNRGNLAEEENIFNEIRAELEKINGSIFNDFQGTHDAIVNAVMGHVHYERVAGHGRRLGKVTEIAPLLTNYFLYPFETTTVSEDEEHAFDAEKGQYLMACNGWVMSDDPMNNFAVYPSQVYLRRELIAWGDCVKLNYRQKPEDCPYLWEYMTKYSVQCAKLFHGFRIDNCHSTPIHVAEYLLAKAREIRPHLYVVAELFTGSEQIDHVFVNRLGITSLIREAQNAPDSHEQGRFVYRYGGDPVGAFRSKTTRPAPASVAHALFFDQTHDNPPPSHKRTVYDHVPTAAMTSIAYCASGSNRGYDEFIPFHIDVVQEARLYSTWPQLEELGGGLVKARKLFNDMHFELCEKGFTELFVDQINPDVVAVTRHNPISHESVLVISHTCFSVFNWNPAAKEIHIADNISEILFEVKTIERPKDSVGGSGDAGKEYLTGDTRYSVEIYENVPFEKSGAVRIENNTISFSLFPSGSVIAFKITPKPSTVESCKKIESLVSNDNVSQQLKALVEPLSAQKLNFLLFRCEKEDLSEFGEGAYEISNVGKFVYCGLEGIYPMIKRIQETNDLGHPLCANLRDGLWLSDYIVRRLQRLTETSKIAEIFESSLGLLKDVPHFLRPCYFELIFTYLRGAVVEVALQKLKFDAFADTKLSQKLSLNSYAFLADISSSRMPVVENPVLPEGDAHPNSLAAGLPHFSEGIWRNWGRDTFIALPGLLLSTGRFDDAKNIILAFGGALRHGLIPNLLGEGKCSRYNCRDAVWFWLSAIVQYCEKAPNGESILSALVARIYPRDDSEYGELKTEKLHETMYEALQRHFEGISFRERNAGFQIDEQMSDDGFNVSAKINHKTGFVEGGNEKNCGTWMDKMGSSSHAGNKGLPATPRDGAAVELQGLALFVAEQLSSLHSKGSFPYDGLHNEGRDKHFTWSEWAQRIRASFPEHFYVSNDTEHEFVNRRNIVKDSVGSSQKFTDFQLRPNFCIALSLVPDILPTEQAWKALQSAAKILLGPLGIRTLDPSDYAYNGNYFNDDQSSNKATAAGWNYHQGPEWLWVAGVFLKALIRVAEKLGDAEKREAMSLIKDKLYAYQKHISTSDWRSLPELTNKDGAFCPGSCPAQAWSISCLIEAIEAVKNSF